MRAPRVAEAGFAQPSAPLRQHKTPYAVAARQRHALRVDPNDFLLAQRLPGCGHDRLRTARLLEQCERAPSVAHEPDEAGDRFVHERAAITGMKRIADGPL